jgi:hypothetical protein
MFKPRRPAEELIQLRNPDRKKKMPHMAKDSYALLHRTAFAVLPKKAPGITLKEFLEEMARRLPKVNGWIRFRDLVRDGDQARPGSERRTQAGQRQAAAADRARVIDLAPLRVGSPGPASSSASSFSRT